MYIKYTGGSSNHFTSNNPPLDLYKKMTIKLSQVILDFDVKTELTSTYDVIPTSGRNLEYKPISEQQRFLGNCSLHCSTSCVHTVVPLVEMTVHLKFNLCSINSHL